MVFIISIEGNIGSGKSTLVSKLKELGNDNFYFLPEPVNDWMEIKDKDNETILSKFYHNTKKYAFSFQMMAYITRVHLLRQAIKENPNRIFITERSIYTDKNVFAKMLYDDEMIEEVDYQIYLKWFDEFSEISENNFKIVYVNTIPEKCYERILKRNRDGESLTLEYLIKCDEYHNNWLKGKEILLLDGNEDKDLNNKNAYNEWIEIINNYIYTLLQSKNINESI